MSEERDLRALLSIPDDDEEPDVSDVQSPHGGRRERGARDGATGKRVAGSEVRGGAKRTHQVLVRFNDAEWDALQRRHVQAGGLELATYVRSRMMDGRVSQGAEREPMPTFRRGDRKHCVMVRFTADELAKLEAHRATVGMPELGAYVRRAALRHTPIPYVPELNRKSWEGLIAHLDTLGGLARHLQQLPPAKPQGGIGGMFGRSKQEELLGTVLSELKVTQDVMQALRRDIMGTPE